MMFKYLPCNFWQDIVSPPPKPEIHSGAQSKGGLIPDPRYTVPTIACSELPFPTSCVHVKVVTYSDL